MNRLESAVRGGENVASNLHHHAALWTLERSGCGNLWAARYLPLNAAPGVKSKSISKQRNLQVVVFLQEELYCHELGGAVSTKCVGVQDSYHSVSRPSVPIKTISYDNPRSLHTSPTSARMHSPAHACRVSLHKLLPDLGTDRIASSGKVLVATPEQNASPMDSQACASPPFHRKLNKHHHQLSFRPSSIVRLPPLKEELVRKVGDVTKI